MLFRSASDEAGPRFIEAVQRFQAAQGLERDGLMNPGGPTVKALGTTLFPKDVTGNTGRPVDLRQVAARAEAAETGVTLGGEGLIFTPEDEAGDTNKPQVRKDAKTVSGKETTKKQDIKWKREVSLPPGASEPRQFNTKGPIRVDQRTATLGIDGLRYRVDWLPLDENGKVIPEFRSAEFRPKEFGGHVLPLTRNETVIEPPYPHPNGFQVTITVPPQASVSGNSAGVSLDIFSSD